jgi:hypothetical protein
MHRLLEFVDVGLAREQTVEGGNRASNRFTLPVCSDGRARGCRFGNCRGFALAKSSSRPMSS